MNFQTFASAAQGLLSPDNTLRQTATSELTTLLKSDPLSFAKLSLEALSSSDIPPQTRQCIAVLLSKQMNENKKKTENLWFQIDNDTRDAYRTAILPLLQTEVEASHARALGNLISDMVSGIYMIEDNCWLEPFELANLLLQTEKREFSGLQVLSGLFNTLYEQMHAHKDTIIKIYS